MFYFNCIQNYLKLTVKIHLKADKSVVFCDVIQYSPMVTVKRNDASSFCDKIHRILTSFS